MAKINAHGATATSLNEYLERLRAAYRAIDPAWNLEPESPDGLALAIWAELLANLDEAVLQAYRSVDPASAVGQQLDRIAFISGLTRQPATHSTATVTFSGTSGTVIPAGMQVRNSHTDTLWATDVAVTISAGTASVGATCTTPGAEPAAAGSLRIIATPLGGVASVTNPDAASPGRDEEPDTLFRVRRNVSVAMPGNNQVDSILAAVANVEGVKRAKVYENEEATPDANGIAPNSILVVADGGADAEIAAAMAARKNPGTGLNADNSFSNKVQVDTQTPAGNPLSVTFYRPVLTTVHVHITVGGPLYPGAALDIRQAVVAYANAELFDGEGAGFDRTGFDIGEPVHASKLFTPVNRVVGDRGHAVSVKVGTDPQDVVHDLVDPGFNGLGVFALDNVAVTAL